MPSTKLRRRHVVDGDQKIGDIFHLAAVAEGAGGRALRAVGEQRAQFLSQRRRPRRRSRGPWSWPDAGAADRQSSRMCRPCAKPLPPPFVFELERGGLDHDARARAAAMAATVAASADAFGKLVMRRAPRWRARRTGERDADAAKRAPTLAIGVVADDLPAGGRLRESTAHDARPTIPTTPFCFFASVVADSRRAPLTCSSCSSPPTQAPERRAWRPCLWSSPHIF